MDANQGPGRVDDEHGAARRDSHLCWHIRPFAGGLLDGTLTGWIRWLVGQHVARCRSCQAALDALVALRERLRALRDAPPVVADTLGGGRWASLETAWTEAERERGG